MAEVQNKRTRSAEDQQKVSVTVEGLDRDLRLGFIKWLPRFQTRIENSPGAAQAWDTLLEGCNEPDLEWAFYWAVDTIDTGTYLPSLKTFHRKSFDLLRRMRTLRPVLKDVMDAKMAGVPIWYAYFGLLGFPRKDAFRFWRLWADLTWFEEKLALCTGKTKGSMNRPKAPLALPGELVHLYVKECTGRPHHEEVSGLLEIAAEAYGLDVKVFSQEAIEQRYKRFCRDYPQKVQELNDDIRELWRKRIDDNERPDLIPFLVAREQAREKPVIEFVKGLYEKARIQPSRKQRKDH
jgi:hypothetical protein